MTSRPKGTVEVEFGPHAAYPDPRVFEILEPRYWPGSRERSLLLGDIPWNWERSPGVQHSLGRYLDFVGIDRHREDGRTVFTMPALPKADDASREIIEEHGLASFDPTILTARIVEWVGQVPVLQGDIFRTTRGQYYVDGLHRGVFIVGRVDVSTPRYEFDFDLDTDVVVGWDVVEPHVHRICKTIRKARNKAKTVAEALPAWEAHRDEVMHAKVRATEARKARAAERQSRISTAEQEAIIGAFRRTG